MLIFALSDHVNPALRPKLEIQYSVVPDDRVVFFSNSDIYIEQMNKGIIMKSPDSNCWKIKMDNDGKFDITLVDCPQWLNSLP